MEKFLPVIRQARLFSEIPMEKILEILLSLHATIAQYPKSSYVYHSGDNIDSLGLVLSGRICIFQDDFWGNRNLLSTVGIGGCFGESIACSSNITSNINVIAEVQTTVMFLNIGQIIAHCTLADSSYHRLIQNLLSDMASKNIYLNHKLMLMSHRSTRSKLLSYLSSEAKRHSSQEFDIPFSRQQLADFLSVDRSGLSAALSKLQQDGLVSYHKNHFILHESPL